MPPQLNESDYNFMEHTNTLKEKRESTSLVDYEIHVKFRRYLLAQPRAALSRAEKARALQASWKGTPKVGAGF